MKNESLALPLVSSLLIHLIAIGSSSVFFREASDRRIFVPIGLVDLPRPEKLPPAQEKTEIRPEIKKPPPPRKVDSPEVKKPPRTPPLPPKAVTPKDLKPLVKSEITEPKRSPPPPAKGIEEPAKIMETPTSPSAEIDMPPSFASRAENEGGGSEAGAGNLFNSGDVGIVPGSGTAGGGGGTAVSGLGRGSGAPGLPVQSAPIKTNREAKPIQTVRASYPPMALRMGMEGDVTLKIIVDGEGKVTKAEIIKSGAMGFDEEALKAVKQSRFEPAQVNGRNVPAEFTFVYRFRLKR